MQLKTLLTCLLAAIVIIGTFGSQNVLAQLGVRQTSGLETAQITNVPAPKTSTTVQTTTLSSTTQVQSSNQTSIQNRFSEEVFYFGICIGGLVMILAGVIIYYYVYGSKRRKESADETSYSQTPQQATQVPQGSAEPDDMMFCIQCGFRIPRKSKTCKECGATQA